MTSDVDVAMGSRNDTVSDRDSCFQSATVVPETWFTDTPSGIASTTSRARPWTTSTLTLTVICDASSPSATSSVIRALARSGSVDRRSSILRFQENLSGRPGDP